MQAFAYVSCPYPVRPSMTRAYRASWDYLSAPGNWWSGAERIAIAQACRDAQQCALCAERKRALSPFGLDGWHGGNTTDAARLTETWLAD